MILLSNRIITYNIFRLYRLFYLINIQFNIYNFLDLSNVSLAVITVLEKFCPRHNFLFPFSYFYLNTFRYFYPSLSSFDNLGYC